MIAKPLSITPSQRLPWHQQPSPLFLAEQELRHQAIPVCDLRLSSPLATDIPIPKKELARIFTQADFDTYHPHPQGLKSARLAIAHYYRERKIEVQPDNIFLCASTSEAYAWLFKLLGDPGDRFLAPTPGYPLFDDLAALENVRLCRYPLIPTSDPDLPWRIDREAFHDAWLPSVKATLIVNPSNPLGVYIPHQDTAFLQQYGPIICDEVFLDYPWPTYPASPPSMAGQTEGLCFTLSGLSKVAAFPHLKLSWIILSGEPRLTTEIRPKLEWIADTYLSVSTPLQSVLPNILQLVPEIQTAIRQRIEQNLILLQQSKTPFIATQAGWYAILNMPETYDDETWAKRLLCEHHIAVYPGYFFDLPLPSAIVISLLPPPEHIARLLQTIAGLID